MATVPLVYPSTASPRTSPVQFNKGHEFYQRELGDSYLDHIVQNRPFTRFTLNGKVYEIRDASASDISNVALRDEQMDSLFIGDESLVRKLIASPEKTHVPLGFYLARKNQENPQTLEMFFYYTSPKYRDTGIGSVQRADFLFTALGKEDIDKTLSIQKPTSNFYGSLDDIFRVRKKFGLNFYEVDMSDKVKARDIIIKKLKALGIEEVQ